MYSKVACVVSNTQDDPLLFIEQFDTVKNALADDLFNIYSRGTIMDCLRFLIKAHVNRSSLEVNFPDQWGMPTFSSHIVMAAYLPLDVHNIIVKSFDGINEHSWQWLSDNQEQLELEEELLIEKSKFDGMLSSSLNTITEDELRYTKFPTVNQMFVHPSDDMVIGGERFRRCQLFHPFLSTALLTSYNFRILLPTYCPVYLDVALLPKGVLDCLIREPDVSQLWDLLQDVSIPKPIHGSSYYYFVTDNVRPCVIAIGSQRVYFEDSPQKDDDFPFIY